jgi:hypothetical protein
MSVVQSRCGVSQNVLVFSSYAVRYRRSCEPRPGTVHPLHLSQPRHLEEMGTGEASGEAERSSTPKEGSSTPKEG